jgi:hypothetical protein
MMNVRNKLFFSRAVLLCVLVGGVVMVSGVFAADLGSREGRQWRPYLEWSVANNTFAGNPFDLVATVTFVHSASGEKHTTEMFYDDGHTWRFRFTGTRPGQWAFTTSSADPELDGHRGTLAVAPNDHAYGFVTHAGNKWARPFGARGELRAFTPQYVMYDGPAAFYGKPKKIDGDIQTFLIEHGFTGFHVPVFCRWFDLEQERSKAISSSDPTPDRRTFEALELLISRVHAAGGVVHFWTWGDEQRNMTPVRWGINGQVDKRLQRYIAARLGPLPGWTMGHGFDLIEWVKVSELEVWRDSMHHHLGWSHLLGGRPAGPQQGTDHSAYRGWNRPLDYASYEHHRPTYEVYTAALEAFPDKPSFSEDRFRIRQSSRYASKDYSMETTRQGLWFANVTREDDVGHFPIAAFWAQLPDGYARVELPKDHRTPYAQAFRMRMGDGWGEDAYLARQPYFRKMPRMLVYETGVHFIDTFRFLAGEIERVYCALLRPPPQRLGRIPRLTTHLHVRLTGNQLAEPVTYDRMIIHDQNLALSGRE